MHCGYTDGSGEYYITIDTDKCNGCGKCVSKCPESALKIETLLIDLDDKMVAMVKEEQRNKIKYTCEPCKPETTIAPCVLACDNNAIKCTWKFR